jgi:tRNA dimethylallyltransferase
MIVILGPTASGKTALAARLASQINGEIISADSRQVYRGMNIGTGKDYEEYTVNGVPVPYHLIDTREPGYEYNIFEFLQDFRSTYNDILSRGKKPVLCGGSGMYIDAIVNGYKLKKIEKNPEIEKTLHAKSDKELEEILRQVKKLHNTTDLLDRERMIRAIQTVYDTHSGNPEFTYPPFINPTLIGIHIDREILRKRITERLEKRIQNGMISEVEQLLDSGITPAQLKFYGLEYRYITLYLEKELNYDDMIRLLNTAIHQFSKRQMTWFRKMEREGHLIHWIDGTLDLDAKVQASMRLIFT